MTRPLRALAAVLLVVLASCISGTDVTNEGVYPLAEDDAARIVRDAMNEEFGQGRVHLLATPNPAYRASVHFGIDTDQVTAEAVPAKGQGEGGAVVDGFLFRVTHRGTAPMEGQPRADSVFARIETALQQMQVRPLTPAEGS